MKFLPLCVALGFGLVHAAERSTIPDSSTQNTQDQDEYLKGLYYTFKDIDGFEIANGINQVGMFMNQLIQTMADPQGVYQLTQNSVCSALNVQLTNWIQTKKKPRN